MYIFEEEICTICCKRFYPPAPAEEEIVIFFGANFEIVVAFRRGAGGQPQIQIPERVQQQVGKMVTQAAVNELSNAFAARFK